MITLNRLLLFVFSLLLCGQAQAVSAVEKRLDNQRLTPLFSPHRATTSSGKPIGLHQFEDARVCSGCHTEIYDEWRESIMSHAWNDPIYRALLNKASVATGGELDNFCTGCHSPVGLTTGRITTAGNRLPPELEHPDEQLPGVDCEACHNMSGISGLDNGAYILQAMARGESLKLGPRADASSPYHQTQYSSLHTSSEICGTCHNVSHPLNGTPIERTYDEWYESPYRQAGIGCQDCHMAKISSKAAVMGPLRQDRASHWFAGGNTTVLEYFGRTRNAENARKLLQSSAELALLEPPAELRPGARAKMSVKVSNTGAGHKLPTGFPEGREVWLDFRVLDAGGNELYRLGRVVNGETEPGTRNFKVHLGDKDGKEVLVEVWNVNHIISDNRILPKGYEVVDYEFAVPADAEGPLSLVVDLNYWPFSQAFADALLGEDKIEVLVENITRLEQQIPLGQAPPWRPSPDGMTGDSGRHR
ncbi:cytochrome c family protein [Zobellella endophytica]|uniref:Cytochrome c family protein n=1 Tax=Zobellella endophytica TaxID=2116700 RepID=A0A2P7R7I5_9GAMM|nr:multiheme c-type cytochrome [Zobellella endophytica]PSJ46153.1 cytochrome c family protein [Zobellella endophytica]